MGQILGILTNVCYKGVLHSRHKGNISALSCACMTLVWTRMLSGRGWSLFSKQNFEVKNHSPEARIGNVGLVVACGSLQLLPRSSQEGQVRTQLGSPILSSSHHGALVLMSSWPACALGRSLLEAGLLSGGSLTGWQKQLLHDAERRSSPILQSTTW